MDFASLDKELTPMQKRAAKERERKERLASLTHIAEDMRKNGASEQSILTAIKGVDEYLKSFKRVNLAICCIAALVRSASSPQPVWD